jgi:hypothetical protein
MSFWNWLQPHRTERVDKIRPITESKNMVFIVEQVEMVIDTDITTKKVGTACW